jgi:hypothetical protein
LEAKISEKSEKVELNFLIEQAKHMHNAYKQKISAYGRTLGL